MLAAQLQNPQGELSLGDPCVDCTPDVPVFQSITDAPMVKALLEAVNADPTRHIHMEVKTGIELANVVRLKDTIVSAPVTIAKEEVNAK